MPRPADTPPPAAAEETGFDPLVFWIQHRTKIVLLVALVVVGAAVYGISEWMRLSKQQGSTQLLSGAKTADDYRKVIAEYPGTSAAGNATLLLAAKLRDEGKYDESTAELKTFAEKYPKHELVSGAWTSMAANLEAQGKVDEALATYQRVSTSYAASFSAPVALLNQARILQGQGKKEEARKIYEQIVSSYQENPASQQATGELQKMK
jgi:TolA-binding protein